MVHFSAVDTQNPCQFYRVKLRLCASSRFTTISMVSRGFQFPVLVQRVSRKQKYLSSMV